MSRLNILVTGGSGYIGQVLIPLLLEQGHKVTNVDSLMYHHKNNHVPDVSRSGNYRLVKGDACEFLGGYEWFDVMIPLAAPVGATACDLRPREAQQAIVEAAKRAIKFPSNMRIIYPNTNSGYGTGGVVDEDSPLNPVSLYGRLKVEAETIYRQRENTVVFRLATVFGVSPRMRLDLLVNDWTYKAVQDRYLVIYEPEFRRNFVHVKDVARAFLFAIERPEMDGGVYNLGNDSANVTKRGLANMVRLYTGCKLYFDEMASDPDKRDYMVSNAKLQALGFSPRYPLDYGIQEVAHWSLETPVPYRNY